MSLPDAVADLTVLAHAAVEEARVHFDEHRDEFDRTYILYSLLARDGTASSAFKAALLEDESFGFLRKGWISTPGMGRVLQDHGLPSMLVRYVLNGGDFSEAVEGLRDLAKHNTSDLEFYAAIVGITVANELRLTDGISLVRWDDVPADERKKFDFDPAHFASNRVAPQFAHPTAAVRVVLPVRQVLFASHEEAETAVGPNAGAEEVEGPLHAAQDAVRCATLAADAPVAIVSSWFRLSNRWANGLIGHAYSYTDALFDFSLVRASNVPVDVTALEVPALFACLGKHPGKDQDVLRLTADRLGMAFRRPASVDKAIDLGIALEAMILRELKDGGELSYRIAVRGAAYAGKAGASRQEIFDLLRSVYVLRSKAVHTGNLRLKPPEDERAVRTLKSGMELASAIARKIIMAGHWPDWEKHVLGAESTPPK